MAEHFAPVFAVIARDAARREAERELAYDAVALLRDAGLTRVHLSWDHGGLGASLVQLIELLIDLAEADSNLPQALHSHYLFTHILNNRAQGPITDWLLGETAAGAIFSNAIVELPPATGYRPTLWDTNGSLNGDKFYTTGALFSDYLLVSTKHPADDSPVLTAVEADHPGVQRVDDWNGFGQRLTASGSTFFNDVPVNPDRTMSIATPSGMLGYPYIWLILAATQVGVGQAALRDISAYVEARRRTYHHSSAETPAQDPLVHQVIGDVATKVSAARYIALGAAADLEAAFEAVREEDDLESQTFIEAHTSANLAVCGATVTISDSIIEATNRIFEAGGASALDASKQLHQHWLNARVLGSHTPLIYRSRMIGDYYLNGTRPPMSTTVRDSAPNKETA